MPLKANSLPTKDSADPMLQGTYVQDDAHDFEPSTDEIAAFEERLNHHGNGNGGVNTTAHAANPRRHSARVPEPARPANHVVPSVGHHPTSIATTSSAPSAAQHGLGRRRLSEAEQEEEIQHKEDVDDVRQLNARFGDADNDSD